MTLTDEQIKTMRSERDALRGSYNKRNELFERYEAIYFMNNTETPKDNSVDPNDWKITTSPSGRNKVTGTKQILDTSDVHIKVKDKKDKAGKSDEIEAGLKTMLDVSGEYKPARVQTDNNLAAMLYGPVVQYVDCVDDLIKARTKDADGNDKQGVNKYIKNQLEAIRKRTPFLIGTINPKESFPKWGAYGMVGHLHEYSAKGSVIKERWPCDLDSEKDYKVQDFFLYENRLVEVESVSEPLFAGAWLSANEEGNLEGVTSIPIFVRYAGGSTLFEKPEQQLQSLLYAYAMGEWDKRENLFWTYLFTMIYQQGMPGPAILQDPEENSDVTVTYKNGLKVIKTKGKLENIQVIDGDVLHLKQLMENETAQSTVQPQTIGGTSDASTFSGYVASVNAGKIVLNDPIEAIEKVSRDTFLHILQRIKSETIENDLIAPADIPNDVDLEVTYEPDLTQDDLRNSQILTQLKSSGANVSDEWMNTNLLKIADSTAMSKQKTKEDIYKAILARVVSDPKYLDPFIQWMMSSLPQGAPETGQTNPLPSDGPTPSPEPPPNGGGMGEQLPKTDAMIPPNERQ